MTYDKLDLLSDEELFKLIDIYEKGEVEDDFYKSFIEEIYCITDATCPLTDRSSACVIQFPIKKHYSQT